MRTIRRLYIYLVTAISLQVVLWGTVNLLRTLLDTQQVGGGRSQLAGALATLIVGLPVFFLHWWLAQRRIDADSEERGSAVRAIFLYGLLLGLLIPIAQNLLAMLDRSLIALFDLQPSAVLVGYGQTWLDNVIALVMNTLIAAYVMFVLRRDWRAGMGEVPDGAPIPSLDNLVTTRRVFRYALVLYSLGLLVYGVQQILSFLLGQLGPANVNALTPLANGLSLTIFGVLLWWNTWRTVQESMRDPAEQRSMFRVTFLYLLSLIGLLTLLGLVGTVLYEALRLALGRAIPFASWLQDVTGPVSTAIPFAVLWAYHMSVLREDADVVPANPRRDGLERLYQYVIAFVGLTAAFVGLQVIGGYLVDNIVKARGVVDAISRNTLSAGISALALGLPIWIRPWLRMNEQARREDDAGDRARGSIVRKAYLYLIIFVGVVGVMISAGGLIFQLLNLALGEVVRDAALQIGQQLKILVLFVVLLLYHWQALRRDSRLEERALAEKHSVFPVLILDSGEEAFASSLVSALREEAEQIPVAVHYASTGAPGEDLSGAGAVVLSAGMAANPPEALRIWLKSFEGTRLVVPVPKPNWVWVDADTTSMSKVYRQVAKAVRRLAEGDEPEGSGRFSPWWVVAAVFGGLFGLSLLISLISALLSF